MADLATLLAMPCGPDQETVTRLVQSVELFYACLDNGGFSWVPLTVPAATDTTCNDPGVICLFAGSASEGGPATSATALAADPADCAVGSYARGITAAGVAAGCTVALDQAAGDARYLKLAADNDPLTAHLEIAGNLLGNGLEVDSSSGAGLILDRGGTSTHYRLRFLTGGSVEWDIGNKGEASEVLGWYANDSATPTMTLTQSGNLDVTGSLDAGGYTENGSNTLSNDITGSAGSASDLVCTACIAPSETTGLLLNTTDILTGGLTVTEAITIPNGVPGGQGEFLGLGTSPSRALDLQVNTSLTASGLVRLKNVGTGDAAIEFGDNLTRWMIGNDATDDSFRLAAGALGTADVLKLEGDGTVTFFGDLTAGAAQMNFTSTRDGTNWFFDAHNITTGEQDMMVINCSDFGGGMQDQSSCFKVEVDGAFDVNDTGSTVTETLYSGITGTAWRHFFEAYYTSNEGAFVAGLDIKGNLGLTGGLRVGAAGVDCGGTSNDCLGAAKIELFSDGTANFGDVVTFKDALDINLLTSLPTCDATADTQMVLEDGLGTNWQICVCRNGTGWGCIALNF